MDNGERTLHEFWLTLPQEWAVISGGTILDETRAEDGQKTVHAASVGGSLIFLSDTAVKHSQLAYGPIWHPEVNMVAMPLNGIGGAYGNGVLAIGAEWRADYRQLPELRPVMFHELAMPGGAGGNWRTPCRRP
jgi:hypothetical protein